MGLFNLASNNLLPVKRKKKEKKRLIFLCRERFSQAFGVFVLFIYTISISIICISQEELSFIVSHKQMYDF